MEARSVECFECGKPIRSLEDLFVVFIYLSLVPLCKDCYAEVHKKTWFTIAPRVPVNHGWFGRMAWTLIPAGIVGVILTAQLTSLAKEYARSLWWVYVLIWFPFWLVLPLALWVRYLSWVRYERPLMESEQNRGLEA